MVVMRKYLNYGKHKVGLMVWAMVMSVMFGCVFARGAGAISYSISYIENVATSMPENELSGLTGAGASTTTLSPTSPAWAGHRFLGWCDQATTKSSNNDTCATGHSHQPGDAISLNQTGANNVKLYAIWQEVCVGYTTMQSLTSSSIATLLPNEHSTATVCDTRDDQTYTIAKLKDGKYWMVENLNIAGGTALSAGDTDVTSDYISNFSTSNNLTKTGNTIVLPASSTSGFRENNHSSNHSYVYNSGNKTNCGASGQNTPCYSYYSWDAATLGSGRTITTHGADAPQSICPKGWRLPTIRVQSASNWQTESDFYALAHQYGLDSNTETGEDDNGFYTQAGPGTTPNFLLAGNYDDGSFYDDDSIYSGGSYGIYWSSTSYDESIARSLCFDRKYVSSADPYFRYYGFSVRCLFRD